VVEFNCYVVAVMLHIGDEVGEEEVGDEVGEEVGSLGDNQLVADADPELGDKVGAEEVIW